MDLDEIAPGLQQLPDTLGSLRQAIEAHDPSVFLDLSNPDALIPVVIGGTVIYLSGCLAIAAARRGRPAASQRHGNDEDDPILRPDNSPRLDRLWWRIHPPVDVMRVDGLALKRTGDQSHCLWLGPTGKGKSAAVATVRIDGKRPTLVVTPDLSDPITAKALYGLPKNVPVFHWTAAGSRSVDFLIGTPGEVAERLTEVFRSGGNGVWKMTARRATTRVIEELDAAGEPRSLESIGERLQEVIANDKSLKAPIEGWVERFLATALILDGSVAAGGIDLAEVLCAGGTVILDNDAFEHPGLTGDIVAFGLSEAKRLANLVPGGFRLIFEEAGQLGDRIDLADPFFRAGRRRGIAVDALTQAESDLNDAISQNSGVRVYYSQRQKSLQKAADDVLDIGHKELDPSRMARYTAWIAADNVRRLVRFPKPFEAPKQAPSVADGVRSNSRMGATDGETRMVPRYRVYEVDEPGDETVDVAWSDSSVPALPPPSTVLEKILDKLYDERGCERWAGKHDKDGYGLVWIDGRWQKIHRVRWEVTYGAIPRNPDGTTQTVDHLSGLCSFKDCSKPTHLELVARSVNSKRSWTAGSARRRGSQGAKMSARK